MQTSELLQRFARRYTRPVEMAGAAMATVAMLLLALRSALRLEIRWDAVTYHLPFAAMHARLHIPYELPAYLQACFHGFPPLPEFIQGLLWRLTGSINATGTINYLALLLFFFFAWRYLGARLWLLVLLSLTAPLVLIHASSTYVDLFSNALLAIGLTGLLAMLLFDRSMEQGLLLWTLAGATAAAWSKYATLPFVFLLFAILLAVYLRGCFQQHAQPDAQLEAPDAKQRARKSAIWVVAALVVASLPLAKNFVRYHNPTWPGGLPGLSQYFPTMRDTGVTRSQQVPPPLAEASQVSLFWHSLLEIDHPTSYPNRDRWIIDQGNAWIAFRSGGFWVVGVLTGTLAAILLGFLSSRRRGILVTVALAVLFGITSVLPQSHELRYFQFLPLTVAAIVAMLLPRIRALYPATAFVLVCLMLGEFVWVSKVNHIYFRVERIGYREAAGLYGITPYWNTLQPGKTYCAVGFAPAGLFLTGPTLHEFHIIDRASAAECPPNATLLQK